MKDLEWCKISEELCFLIMIMNSKFSKKIIVIENDMKTRKMGWLGPIYLDLKNLLDMDSSKSFLPAKKNIIQSCFKFYGKDKV